GDSVPQAANDVRILPATPSNNPQAWLIRQQPDSSMDGPRRDRCERTCTIRDRKILDMNQIKIVSVQRLGSRFGEEARTEILGHHVLYHHPLSSNPAICIEAHIGMQTDPLIDQRIARTAIKRNRISFLRN